MSRFTSEKLFQNKVFKYTIRIVALYALSYIFKSFDFTFTNTLKEYFLRSEAFSLLFIIFGLNAWEGATIIAHYIERKVYNDNLSRKLLVLCISLLLFGLLTAFLFGLAYALFDIMLYKNDEAWKSFIALSYDLNLGIFIFYLLLLAISAVIFYYKNWKTSQLNTERLIRENIQAKYDVLKSQIDPHFFFNSLSVLTNLVYKSPDLSAEYITQLAKSYRYILDKKFENLVTIQTELEFLESYTFLIHIRHENSIEIKIDINDKINKSGLIPPATLQMLVENAVKHNRFSIKDPLHITIKDEGDCIVVTNDLRKRLNNSFSTKMGLDNIAKRYELTGDKQIEIIETTDKYLVKIPILYDYESSNI